MNTQEAKRVLETALICAQVPMPLRDMRVNCVAPGFIETDMTAGLPEEQQKALLGQIALGHLGKPADIAHAVAYLASPQAGYVTGQELHVNGGMYM